MNINAQNKNDNDMETLNLTQEWDKTFPKSDKVNHQKVTFDNRYGITLAADLYIPKDAKAPLPAIVVAGPYGAVKEQASGLYAQHLAERGFLTIAFDPSFTGESGGQPRYVSSPDINTEDYSGAVDYLMTRDDVDHDKIGIVGICGWAGISISAALQDTRIKATVASTMGAFDDFDRQQRIATRKQLNDQRTVDAREKKHTLAGGLPEERPAGPAFFSDYWDYYKTQRGYHPRSLNSNGGWQTITLLPWLNFNLFDHADEIEAPVLVIHGEKAYSLPASIHAFERMTAVTSNTSRTSGNKELMVIPGASHTDLYDQLDIIPFDKIESFFKENLK